MEQLGLLMAELRQRGPCLSVAGTSVPWGDVGKGGESRVCALAAAGAPSSC